MKKAKKMNSYKYLSIFLLQFSVVMCMYLTACGGAGGEPAEAVPDEGQSNESSSSGEAEGQTILQTESAVDGQIDFEQLQAYNPDIFAWLYVPGTNIDLPILQSGIADDYYETHTDDGAESITGAAYTEMANLTNMCDFNTIIHGKDGEETDLFYELHLFENPDFFLENDTLMIYLPDNVLTYQIFTAYYDEGSNILRRFDYTTYEGCQDYLEQMYGIRDIHKNLREGWGDLTPYHFLVTLNGSVDAESQTQYVVIGALTEDKSQTIDRIVLE